MTRLSYVCDNSTKVGEEEDGSSKPFPCAPDKYCFYCCCNPQCCFVIQRRTPKHLWDAWYFWLGVALLVIIVLSTVGTYVVTNCKQNLQAIGYGAWNNRSSTDASNGGEEDDPAARQDGPRQQQQQQQQRQGRNEISINIIPTSAVLPTHRKIMFIAPQPGCTHLTPIVA